MSQTEAALIKNGSVTADDLASTLDLSSKTVTLPSGTGGKILQVTQNSDTTTDSYSTVQTDRDFFSHTITPLQSNSNILVLLTYFTGKGNNETFYLKRGTTKIGGVGFTTTPFINTGSFYNSDNTQAVDDYVINSNSYTFYDTGRAAGTSTLTYTFGGYIESSSGGLLYYNRAYLNTTTARGRSTMVLIEVAS
ncbi:MAG: hypothetical protein ACO29Y_05975 [Holophagaceae bacterium]